MHGNARHVLAFATQLPQLVHLNAAGGMLWDAAAISALASLTALTSLSLGWGRYEQAPVWAPLHQDPVPPFDPEIEPPIVRALLALTNLRQLAMVGGHAQPHMARLSALPLQSLAISKRTGSDLYQTPQPEARKPRSGRHTLRNRARADADTTGAVRTAGARG
jgi:hypothetical protein